MIVSHSLGIVIFIFFFYGGVIVLLCSLVLCSRQRHSCIHYCIALFKEPNHVVHNVHACVISCLCQRRCLMTMNHIHTRCALPYQCVMQRLPAFLFVNVRHLAHVQTSTCRSYFNIRRVSWRPLQFSFLHLGCFALAPPEFCTAVFRGSSFALHCFGQWWVMSLQFK